VAAGNDVILWKNGKAERRNTISEEYTALKSVDHVPLGLFVLLNRHVDEPLSEAQLATLRGMQAHAAAALTDCRNARLQRMLDTSVKFANAVLASGKVTRRLLDDYISDINADTMANVDDAVALEMSALDAAVQDFRKEMTPEEWKNLHVVVSSGHMPRIQERRMQYFQALVGEPEEGHRVVFQEGGDGTIDSALDLLATHVLDESISREYFKNDPWRMHRDLLSDAAKKWLQEHPPAK
jgi:hypothetical protein